LELANCSFTSRIIRREVGYEIAYQQFDKIIIAAGPGASEGLQLLLYKGLQVEDNLR
jgi:hypothetical protein